MLNENLECTGNSADEDSFPETDHLPSDIDRAQSRVGTRELGAASKWVALVARIQGGDPRGEEELYGIVNGGVRFRLYRQLPIQEIDDTVHNIFIIVLQAIRKRQLRAPERLLGFIWTVTHRQVVAYIDTVVETRKTCITAGPDDLLATAFDSDPENATLLREQSELMSAVLMTLREREREILRRFYMEHQTQQRICAEMRLTATPYRLLKSRAKARFLTAALKALKRTLRVPPARAESLTGRGTGLSKSGASVCRVAGTGAC